MVELPAVNDGVGPAAAKDVVVAALLVEMMVMAVTKGVVVEGQNLRNCETFHDPGQKKWCGGSCSGGRKLEKGHDGSGWVGGALLPAMSDVVPAAAMVLVATFEVESN